MKKIVSLVLAVCIVCIVPISIASCGLFMSAEERTLAVAEDLRANSTGEFLFMQKNPSEDESYSANYLSVTPSHGFHIVRAHKSLFEKYGIDPTNNSLVDPFDKYFFYGEPVTTHLVRWWPDETTYGLPYYVTQFRTSDPAISVYGISVGLKDINVRGILEGKGFSLVSTHERHALTVQEEEGAEPQIYFRENMSLEEAANELAGPYGQFADMIEFHYTSTCEKYSNNGINVTVYYSEDGEITEMYFHATTTRNNHIDF